MAYPLPCLYPTILNPYHALPLPTPLGGPCLAPAHCSLYPFLLVSVCVRAVGAHDGGKWLVVVPQAAAPSPPDPQRPAASDAVCLGGAAASQHHTQVSHHALQLTLTS